MRLRTRTGISPTTSSLLCNRMLVILRRNTGFIKVSHLFAFFSLKSHYSSTSFTQEQQSNPHKSHKSHIDASAVRISSVTKSILDQCSDLLIKTTQPSTTIAFSLTELLLSVSNLNPRITRKFWRKSGLEPQDVLDLLLPFESNAGKSGIDVKKVESLLGVFNWASSSCNHTTSFKHLDRSFKIMVGLLVRVGLFKEADSLLLAMDKEGISLDNHEVFSNLIEWHVRMDELEKSIHVYDRMRTLNFSPSFSCYRTLLNYLVNKSQPQLLFRVYSDMLEIGISEKGIYENVIQALCKDGKVQESRNLIKKAFISGIKPTSVILDAIASGYCEKKDYDDLMSLFTEMCCIPDVIIGNKIIHSMCQNFGVEEAFLFLKELEHLGFIPDTLTFGILISWSCQEENLKNAFIFLSDLLSRGLKPHIYSYNSIISGVFKKDMWNHAKDIFLEMEDKVITLDMSTFRVLLAGYCKARRFDEVKLMIEKMVQIGLIDLSPLQYPISKAFILLGIDPLGVRIRRDNDVAFSKTEFYDTMGNGLYLEGDVVDFDRILTSVLDDSLIPDYNRLLLQEDFLTLLKNSHSSNSNFKTITTFLNYIPSLHELDGETLNLLVQWYTKRGFVHKAQKLFDEMLKRNVNIENKTYSAVVKGLCKKGNSNDLQDCLKLVQSKNWLPILNDYKTLICSLCNNSMVMEALFLFEHAMLDYPHEVPQLFHTFLENLCEIGFTKVAYSLLEKLLERGYELDHVTYTRIVQGLCKENRFSEVFLMCDKMLTKNVDLDHNVDFYNVLLHGYCTNKDLRKVNEVLGVILKKNITIYISSYNKFVSLMCNTGQFQFRFRFRFALWIKDFMVKQNSSNETVHNILIFHLFASGNISCVEGLFNMGNLKEVVNFVEKLIVKDLVPVDINYDDLIKQMCVHGRKDKALDLFDTMLKKGNIPISESYNCLIQDLCVSNKIEEALDMYNEMLNMKVKPSIETHEVVIEKLCEVGRTLEAEKVIDDLICEGEVPSKVMFGFVVSRYRLERKFFKASEVLKRMQEFGYKPDFETQWSLISTLSRFSGEDKEDDSQNFLSRLLSDSGFSRKKGVD